MDVLENLYFCRFAGWDINVLPTNLQKFNNPGHPWFYPRKTITNISRIFFNLCYNQVVVNYRSINPINNHVEHIAVTNWMIQAVHIQYGVVIYVYQLLQFTNCCN